MSVNKYHPHVFILPEDDANSQIANGFWLTVSTRQIQVLSEVGGWKNVQDRFASDHIAGMKRYDGRHMILVVDCDGESSRLQVIREAIPETLRERVFVLGALTDPEALKRTLHKTYETIGSAMAEDCRNGTQDMWGHELLRHNEREIHRLRAAVCGFLFPTT